VLTIEIEHVNSDALLDLEKEGVVVHPNPSALKKIQDKGLQKLFYESLHLATAPFFILDDTSAIREVLADKKINFPFVCKTRTMGYDGKGVQIIKTENDLKLIPNASCVIEEMLHISQEIAVIVARNAQGESQCYDPVSMDFHAEANMLDLLQYPALLDEEMATQAKEIALQLIEAFDICGLLAVEFIIDNQQRLWINEVAPRPHNSGHQTIESSVCSQYEQHIRAILNLPLGSTQCHTPSVMINLLGAEGFEGDVYLENVEDCLKKEGVHIHLYGKKKTKPFRKMGHATVCNKDINEAKKIAIWVKQHLQLKSL
ncbi:MAG: ATP-grasp domain-containing protein, partial [Chitinophagaceae bacterium]